MRSIVPVLVPVWLLAAPGCNNVTLGASDPTDADGVSDGVGPGDDDDDNGNTETTLADRPLAGGLSISKISMYQGVEAILYENGKKPTTLEMPAIVGRGARVRVFVEPDGSFEPRKVTGILTLDSAAGLEPIEATAMIDGPSKDEDPSTTLNFDIDGIQVRQATEMSLEIVEQTADGPGGGKNADVTWSSVDNGGLDTDTTDELQVVIVPVKYNYDGSGRLPDTSQAQQDLLTELAMGIYPATNVVVRVGEVFEWNREIGALDGEQWGDLLSQINTLRDRANEPPNTYYYATFMPEPTLNAYCRVGCILGLSLLAFNANDPYFRASIGVGYTGTIFSETQVHEMGHAHGRDHAPCGVSGDRNYPYNGAKIGAWGYSITTGEMFQPVQTVDMMSYCTPIWVSDYTQYYLYKRINTVASQNRLMAPRPRTAVRLGADGLSTPMNTVSLGSTDGAPRIDVRLFDATGHSAGLTDAAYFPYDHIDGGMVVLDDELPTGWRAEALNPPARP